jgi:hypothetical protein
LLAAYRDRKLVIVFVRFCAASNSDGTINAIVVNGRHVENEHLILDAK